MAQTQPLVAQLREAGAAPHQLEYSDLGALLKKAADRVEFLESVAGPVSKATAFDRAQEPTTHE